MNEYRAASDPSPEAGVLDHLEEPPAAPQAGLSVGRMSTFADDRGYLSKPDFPAIRDFAEDGAWQAAKVHVVFANEIHWAPMLGMSGRVNETVWLSRRK